MTQRIKRNYINVQGRQVHFRSGGTGPVVLLLHQSPQSSAAMLPLAEKLVSRYCVIAPDSPGFGLSDPLKMTTQTIEDMAHALDEFTTAIQLPRATVIGVHTGAQIALEFGLRFPEKTDFLILDGLALFNEEESADILEHYLPPFIPDWDGSHLTWLWARLREQVIFFPWYRKGRGARMHYDMPGAEYLHGWFMDFMYAGDEYRGGYGAAFRYRNSAAIKDIIPPTAALYRTGDVLESHRQRLPALPDHAWSEIVPPGSDKMDDRIMELLKDRAAGRQSGWRYRHHKDPPGAAPDPSYIDAGDLQFAVLTAGNPDRPALLLLHDLAGSSASVRDLVIAFASEYRVTCPDLPGHGESGGTLASGFSMNAAVTALSELLAALGNDTYHLLSLGASCVFVPWLIRHNPGIDFRAGMHNPLLLDAMTRNELRDRFALPIEPDEYGIHITKLWYAVRDGRLFWPWYEPVSDNIRLHTPSLDPADIHQSLFDALRCGRNYHHIWREFFATDVVSEMRRIPQRLSVTISKTHPCHEDALAALTQQPMVSCEETLCDSPDVIAAHFSR